MGYSWPVRHKYGAKKTNGFASKLENAVHEILLLREKAGEITSIQKQARVFLGKQIITYSLTKKKKVTLIYWKVDFSFIDRKRGVKIWCEAKGFESEDYKTKLNLWREKGPGPLEIWKGSYKSPVLIEVIDPKKVLA